MEHEADNSCSLCGSTEHNRSSCPWHKVSGKNPTPLLIHEIKRRERIAAERRAWHQKSPQP